MITCIASVPVHPVVGGGLGSERGGDVGCVRQRWLQEGRFNKPIAFLPVPEEGETREEKGNSIVKLI